MKRGDGDTIVPNYDFEEIMESVPKRYNVRLMKRSEEF